MKKLIVLVGPTGVGKTELSLKIAEHYGCDIISIDSRQLYRGIEIGTAAPSPEQRTRVQHHFVGTLRIDEYFSASDYEDAALKKIEQLHHKQEIVVATGGSMMYVDALCDGVDLMPSIDDALRTSLYERYQKEGLENILSQLRQLDPIHYNKVDQKNYKRVLHALEVCLQTGKPYSSFLTGKKKERPFEIIKVGIERDRQELYQRINNRVDEMIQAGLMEETKRFHPLKHLNALNTVGYKELFKYLDGEWELDFAVEKIKQNTRTYAKQQMRWFKKDLSTTWFNLSLNREEEVFSQIINHIEKDRI